MLKYGLFMVRIRLKNSLPETSHRFKPPPMGRVLDIGLLGADGRMGGAILRVLGAEPRARLTAAITSNASPNLGQDAGEIAGLKPLGIALTSDIRAALNQCDVLIDFSCVLPEIGGRA